MKIGLLSDTHGFLDEKLLEYFKDCDEIWHAGDIGEGDVDIKLSAFKKFRAVYGNIDSKALQLKYPENLFFECEGLKVWMTHIGGTPPAYKPKVKRQLLAETPDIFICGHSHILKIAKDAQLKNMVFINPGAAGNHGFHFMKTIVRLEINLGQITNLEVIELGKRGTLGSKKMPGENPGHL